ncbi:MAG TPA: hypothetical protein VFJ82_07845 [Longimicrobium sp.]|nr:hypothetical protein [Longimicrobium sp.]
MLRRTLAIALLAAAAACEGSPAAPRPAADPSPEALFLPVADADYRLPGEDRARLPATLDLDALQALLARMRPEHRADFIAFLADLADEGQVSVDLQPLGISDPELVALIARVTRHPVHPPPRP